MSGVNLFALSSQYATWLTARQEAVSQNVANANTPGYTSVDVRAFSQVLDNTTFQLARTEPGHQSFESAASTQIKTAPDSAWDKTLTGNTVNLEQELMKAGDVNRSYAVATGVAKAFQHMYLMTVKV